MCASLLARHIRGVVVLAGCSSSAAAFVAPVLRRRGGRRASSSSSSSSSVQRQQRRGDHLLPVVVDDAASMMRSPEEEAILRSGAVINWYPGHIAKAERQLKEQLKNVDVVVEARDARIAATTAHPNVAEWLGPDRPRVVAYTFVDHAPEAAIQEWRQYHRREKESKWCFWLDAKQGKGDVGRVKVAIRAAAKKVNEKRAKKGIKPRPVRCAVIGFPNVGKSALMNKLAGRKVAKSENRAGVTRHISWLRPSHQFRNELELLDSPGIIPARQVDQTAAARLAMCGDVGGAAYDDNLVAEALCDTFQTLPKRYLPDTPGIMRKRYQLDLWADYYEGRADVFLEDLAERRHSGNLHVASSVLLADFRNGRLGRIALEPPPAPQDARDDDVGLLLSSSSSSGFLENGRDEDDAALALPDERRRKEEEATRTLAADLKDRLQHGDFDGW